jgi:MFS transporter, PHS family, inorganic phosphate transporter
MKSSQEALRQLDESPLSSFHLKTVITSGMGFFTDAYDLFVIGVVSTILKLETIEKEGQQEDQQASVKMH